MEIGGKIAIVNGASSGIGRSLALELAKQGATVTACARREDKLKQALEEIKPYASESSYRVCDCTRDEDVKETVRWVHARHGRIDIMLNVAGIFEPKFVVDATWQDYYRDMDVCFLGAVRFNHEVLPIMLDQKRGVILNTSSINEQMRPPGISAYSATKAAVYAYSDTLYKEVSWKGVHVGVIQPVLVETEMTEATGPAKPRDELIKEFAQGSLEHYQEILTSLKIQDPVESAREIIKRGIVKEYFEVYTGKPQIWTAMGLTMKTLPGLSRGMFSLLMAQMEQLASVLEENPAAAEALSGRSPGASPGMRSLIDSWGPFGSAMRNLFVAVDEGVNRTIYRSGKILQRLQGLRRG